MDEYNLINSKVISEHCRKIEHKFNTEELAVLIYRNKRLGVNEKITLYNELIENYPDMEVIERINCKHYDSVKTMIQNEITRLKYLVKKLQKNELDCIYTYQSYYQNGSMSIIEGQDEIKTMCKNYTELVEKINAELKENEKKEEKVINIKIGKRNLSKENKYVISAEYVIDNNDLKMVNIYDFEADDLDIDNICLNIPNPFKKGDLLVSTSKIPFSNGYVLDYDKFLFVLENLCTFDEKFQKRLDKGNCDSSDMVGWGYMIARENDVLDKGNFYAECVHDYDNWEYYDEKVYGKLQGMKRILKGISNYLKDEISLDLLLDTYYEMKIQEQRPTFWNYTEEGLILAGFEKDIGRIEKGEE